MPFQLPLDYLLGMAGWLLMLGLSLVSLVALRRRWGGDRRNRLKWVNAGLSLWIFLTAITSIEAYVAIVYDQSDAFNMTNVSKHWFARHVEPFRKTLRFADGFFTSYRDTREFPRKIKPGQHHICFIGD